LNHILRAQSVGGFGDGGKFLRAEDDLRPSLSVAEIHKGDTAVVAARIHPPGEGDGGADVFSAK
jgi:hypothetical protein